MSDARPQLGIIGAGRVAQALALAFASQLPAPPLLFSKDRVRSDAAARTVGAVAVPDLAQLADRCDIVAIAVSDDALDEVAASLTPLLRPTGGAFIFHVSGRSGAAPLDPLRRADALTAAIHPAMTFTGDPENEVARMTGARFAVTGSTPDATERAKAVVGLLGGIAVEIAEDRRALYHAALCHASNHLVTLIAGAAHALESAGIDDPPALLAPLVRAALENSLAHGFAGLSGPLLRGDTQTIAGHLETLRAHDPDLLPAYRAMAQATVDALKHGEMAAFPHLAALDRLLAVP
ncbi:MAG: DUF2520 domain-containing protein [Sphingopyxis sp.]|nr:DUF2520 domain-containing protein [Sphingopyxis sp.]